MSHDPSALVPFGWSPRVQALLADHVPPLVPARVLRVERGACRAVTPEGDVTARTSEAPSVGDWVGLDGSGPPAVRATAERWSALSRLDPHGDRVQVLAANVDVVLVTCPADRPSIARVERETVLGWDSGARPVVLVTKADLDDGGLAASLAERLVGVDVLTTSARDRRGIDELAARLAPGLTAVALGPSGAGKSSLINALLGEDRLATGAVRDDDARGRHTTTARELVALPAGGVVIDTPGLRSLGLVSGDDAALDHAFEDVAELAAGCRFRDCGHDREPGCAVTAAVADGALDAERLASYRKLARELAYEARRVDPVAARAERDRWKTIHRVHRRDRRKP